MRFGLLSGAVLTLGIGAAIPSVAKADRVHDDRGRTEHRDVRVERSFHDDRGREVHRDVIVERRPEIIRDRVIVREPVIVSNDVDYPVNLSTVPGCVMSTLDRQCGGRIEAVQFVRRDGQEFYRFRIDGARGCVDVRIALDGDLLGIAPAA